MKPLGENLKALKALKDEKKAINAELKLVDEKLRLVEGEVMDAMEQAGLDRTAIDGFSVSMKIEVQPQIEDFETFANYVFDQRKPELLYRRVNAGAYRELIAHGEEVPGVAPFEQQKLNTRSS